MNHKLCSIEVELRRDELLISKVKIDKATSLARLRYFLRIGDFKSKRPFGILKQITDREFYVISAKPKKSFQVKVGTENFYVLEAEQSSIQNTEFQTEKRSYLGSGYTDLLLTSIYINSCIISYENPSNVRSFFNKKSKGILSKRDTPIDKYVLKDDEIERVFTIHEAMSIKAWHLENERILLLPFPRFELMETEFSFPMDYKLRKLLNEIWCDYIFQKSTSIADTLNSVLEDLVKLTSGLSIVKNSQLSERSKYFSSLSVTPIRTENNNVYTFENNISEENFFKRLTTDSNLPKVDIMVYIDESVSDKSETQIQKFIDDLSNFNQSRITIEEESLDQLLELENSEIFSNPVLFIINDKIRGAEGIYRKTKTRYSSIPNKVILLSTIEKYYDNPIEEIIYHTYLPLMHRKTGFLPWISLNQEFDMIIGCEESVRMGGAISVYGLSILAGKTIDLDSGYVYRFSGYKSSMMDILVKKLSKVELNQNSKILILIKGMQLSEPEITGSKLRKNANISNEIVVAYIDDREQGRILKTEGNDFNPMRGSMLPLCNCIHFLNFLLITTGFPDITDEKNIGFTRPILVQLCKEDLIEKNDSQNLSVVQTIFDLTFIHPTSISQSKLPLPLNIASRMIKNDLYFLDKDELNVKGVM